MSESATITQQTGGQGEPATIPQTGKLYALLAEFPSTDALREACVKIRDAGYTRWDAHSPYPVHGIDPCMGIRMTRLPIIVFCGGLIGCLTGLGLQWFTNATSFRDFPFLPTFVQGFNYLVSGKPYFSLPANIPVIFELTILFSALTAGIGMLVMNNLPLFYNPLFNSRTLRRCTTDGLAISVEAADRRFDPLATERLLADLGGTVERVYEYPSQEHWPRGSLTAAVLVGLFLLVPLAIVFKARNAKTATPPIHIVQDMDNQERYEPQQANPAFQDGRAMRPPVGMSADAPLGTTVARGELRNDPAYYTGIVAGKFVSVLPSHRPEVVIDEAFLARGQEKFTTFCAPCHGLDGSGQGMVAQRVALKQLAGSWVQPASLHDAEILGRPVGHLFNTITRGIRTMPAYGDQLPEADRWAIVAYVRALQRSQNATMQDVPPEVRAELESR